MRVLRDAFGEWCNHRLSTSLKEYQDRTFGSKQWWMNWQEAKKYHAVDKIVDSVHQVVEDLRKGF